MWLRVQQSAAPVCRFTNSIRSPTCTDEKLWWRQHSYDEWERLCDLYLSYAATWQRTGPDIFHMHGNENNWLIYNFSFSNQSVKLCLPVLARTSHGSLIVRPGFAAAYEVISVIFTNRNSVFLSYWYTFQFMFITDDFIADKNFKGKATKLLVLIAILKG